MIKEGMVILNTKHHPCVILKVDDRYCWLFAKTPKGYKCNHYGKWYIEDSIDRKTYKIVADYETWQKAVNDEVLK